MNDDFLPFERFNVQRVSQLVEYDRNTRRGVQGKLKRAASVDCGFDDVGRLRRRRLNDG